MLCSRETWQPAILFGTARAVPRGGKFPTCRERPRGGKFPTCPESPVAASFQLVRELMRLLRAATSPPGGLPEHAPFAGRLGEYVVDGFSSCPPRRPNAHFGVRGARPHQTAWHDAMLIDEGGLVTAHSSSRQVGNLPPRRTARAMPNRFATPCPSDRWVHVLSQPLGRPPSAGANPALRA